MSDLIRKSVQSGHVILHEEVARDGAQGKTLLTGAQRTQIAKRQSRIFNGEAKHHLVFNAGFPSAGKEEYEAIREVVQNVEECYVGAAGRAIKEDVDQLLNVVNGAQYGRIFIAIPSSDRMAHSMLHCSAIKAAAAAVDIVAYAKERRPEVQIDIAMVDACRADVAFVADIAAMFTEAGASMVIVCDTVGALFPSESRCYFTELVQRADKNVKFIAHMHNDLGFGLVNTLEALSAGVFGLTSSWLSLGERAGMAATEQLLFILGYEPKLLSRRLTVDLPLWRTELNLKLLLPIARFISQATGKALSITDPIVGTGVNSISTGTPFTNPELFQPFNPEAVLGMRPQVVLTALASKRVIIAIAAELGLSLTNDEIILALQWVKTELFSRCAPVLDKNDLLAFLNEHGFGKSRAIPEQRPNAI